MYHFALAWRYTHGRLVNYIAVAAVAMCLAVQIVVMAVLDGLLEDMRRRVRDLGEQITVSFLDRELLVSRPSAGLPTLPELEAAEATLRREVPEVRGITPLLRGYGVLERRGDFAPTVVFGIDLARELRYSQLSQHLQVGKIDRESPMWLGSAFRDRGLPPMFVGAELAERLGIAAGDEVALAYAAVEKKEMERRTFVVANIFRSGSPWKDDAAVYIPLAVAQELFLDASAGDTIAVPVFSVWLSNPDRANELEDKVLVTICRALGRRDGRSYTWQKSWRIISEGMEYENNLQEIILALMNLSGGFCVFAILATLVSRRVRDVGLLRCLGAGRASVGLVFLLVGFFIGFAGAALGTLAGYLLAQPGIFFAGERPLVDWIFEKFTGHPLYPVRMFEIAGFRPIFGPKAAYYAAGALVVSLLAALYPAVWAGLRQPIQSLREE